MEADQPHEPIGSEGLGTDDLVAATELERRLEMAQTEGTDTSGKHEDEAGLAAFALRIATQLRAEDRRPSAATQRVIAQVRTRTGAREAVRSDAQEDPGWRGDLALVGNFLRRRLADSALLRLAAASLLVHLVAVPFLLAYVLLEQKRPEVHLGFTPAPDPEPFGLDKPDLLEEFLVLELEDNLPLGVSNTRAWDAEVLRSSHVLKQARAVADGAPAQQSDPLGQWLMARATQLRDARPLEALSSGSILPKSPDHQPLQRLVATLITESWLDGVALGWGVHPALSAALEDLSAALEDLSVAQGEISAPERDAEEHLRRLEQRVLERARSYGVPFRSPEPAGEASPTSSRPAIQPLDRAWLEDLRAAAQALGLREAQALWDSER